MTPHEQRLIDKVIAKEGGFVDHPDDRGGATNFGITAATLGGWRGLGRSATAAEVKALPRVEAEQIYLVKWVRHPSLSLHMLVSHAVAWWALDTAVLFGVSRHRAGKWMQEAAGALAMDGVIGPQSIARINATPLARMLVRCTRLRMARHCQVVEERPSQAVFIEGWTARALSHLDALETP